MQTRHTGVRDGSKIGRKNVGIHFSGSECSSTLESRRWFLHSYENSLEIIADVINLRELGLSLHAVAATPPMWPQTEMGLFPFVCLCRIVPLPRYEMAKTKLPKEKLEPLYSRMEEQERERETTNTMVHPLTISRDFLPTTPWSNKPFSKWNPPPRDLRKCF